MAGSNSAYRAVLPNVDWCAVRADCRLHSSLRERPQRCALPNFGFLVLPHPLLNLPAQMADALDVLPAQLATDLPLMRV